MRKQVFLGGSCGSTTWRRDVAVPALRRAGIGYFDPQLALGAWTPAREAEEMRAKNEAEALLFVISGETRGVASIAEAAYLLAARRPLSLAVDDVPEGATIDGRRLEPAQCADLNRGRIFLRSMAEAHGVPVFASAKDAVEEVIRLVRARSRELTLDDLTGILREITCGDHQFAHETVGDGYLVWIEARGRDARTGMLGADKGRAWFIRRTDSKSQVIQTLLKAELAWHEHEVREHFRYRGAPVFTPHFAVERLVDLCDERDEHSRDPAGER